MHCEPEVLLDYQRGSPQISVILIDWGTRESFHTLHYLNQQTIERSKYELIWVEFYDRKPEALQELASRSSDSPLLDKWIVLGYPDALIFHKHRLYNVGLVAASGEICVFCKSDAIVSPTFIESLLRVFEETTEAVIHLDEVRNEDYRFYPFNYPSRDDILGFGCVNWNGMTTHGLCQAGDRLHKANYGACLAARRRDLLAIGGADEHLDYLGFMSGPQEMSFRLGNHLGRLERWLTNEYVYHIWHANSAGVFTNHHGPHDAGGLPLLALEARCTRRTEPYLPNSWFGCNDGKGDNLRGFLDYLKSREEPAWLPRTGPARPSDHVYQIENDYHGFRIHTHAGRWYALFKDEMSFQPQQARLGAYRSLIQADSLEELQMQIEVRSSAGEAWVQQALKCRPQLLLNRKGKPKISVILIDWGVRESFHSLHYLNRQTARREDYELIWLEFYDRRPEELSRMVAAGSDSAPVLDKWIVMGYPDDFIFHKHRLYNIGILASDGAVCVICDSDAIYPPTFIDSLIQAFTQTPNAVIHVDEVRNNDPGFYPFNYPSIEEVTGPGAINWNCATECTDGVDSPIDPIHQANYGACLAARRRDLLAIGGADEHLDYLGYVCGPYDLTFRLVSLGRTERWLRHEFIYHVWHPNQSGCNVDYHGPHDGMFMSVRALDSLARERIKPCQINPWILDARRGQRPSLEQLLEAVAEHEEPHWRPETVPVGVDDVYWINKDHKGFNIFLHAGVWYALNPRQGIFDPNKAQQGHYPELLWAPSREGLLGQVAVRASRLGDSCILCRMRRLLRSQPLRSLPGKLWRKTRRMIAARGAKAPW